MSLRCYIRGFRLEKMRAMFGSRDAAAYKAAADAFKEEFGGDEDEDEEEREEAEKVLAVCRRAIFEGVPFDGLDAEDSSHVRAASILASVGQKHKFTSFEDWKVTHVFPPFFKDYAKALPPRGRELLTFLAEGRPLFGRSVNTDWSYCAYMALDEVKELHAALAQLREQRPELKGEGYLYGFVDALMQGLAEVIKRRQDLWLDAG
jgi:hypothetical protein